MENINIIRKAREGGWNSAGHVVYRSDMILDPLFWEALFRNKTEALIPRQKFFSILFGDEGGEEGFEKAISWLSDLIK